MNKLATILLMSVLAIFCFLSPNASTQTVQSSSQTPQPPSITQLSLVVTDLSTKKNASQQANFVIQ
ncbi:MAG: hypothetical protein ACREBG_10230 [Pyrinomonadaceae bacterium]